MTAIQKAAGPIAAAALAACLGSCNSAALPAAASASLSGSNPKLIEQNRLQQQIAVAESDRAALSLQANTYGQTVSGLKAQEQKYLQAIEEEQIAAKAYMMNHKLAVAALVAGVGGVAMAVDNGSTLDQQSREIAGLVGAFAVIWAIANHEEVLAVADKVTQSASHLKDLEAAAARAQQERQAAQNAWQSAREAVDAAEAKLRSLQTSLQISLTNRQ